MRHLEVDAMSGAESIRMLVERFLLFPVRMRHGRRARPRHRARASAIATTRRTLQGATGLNAGNVRTVFNVGLYLLLLDQDLADFTDDLVNATGDRRRRFIAKHEAVLLYEAAEDLPQLLGKDFREAVRILGTPSELLARLNTASSDLSRFWKDERTFLGTIRNAIAAHREKDARRYLEVLESVEPLEVMKRAADFSGRLEHLIDVITEIALLTSSVDAIIRDMLASRQR
jgi:hypothetical protein